MDSLVNVQFIVNEISLKNNNINEGEFRIAPQLSRTIGIIDDAHATVQLVLDLRNTKDNTFPIDIKVDITGIFDISNLNKEEIDQFLKLQAVHIMYPYIRTIISNVTSSAMMPPVILPIIDVKSLFPEE